MLLVLLHLKWTLTCVFIGVFAFRSADAHSCVAPRAQGADDQVINEILSSESANASVFLCQSAVFHLEGPIVFRAEGQSISTVGLPQTIGRATLEIDGKNLATAIIGDCDSCSAVQIRNIIIDGGRQRLGRVDGGGALILVGGNTRNQLVKDVRAYEPRGWSNLHVFEGDGRCTKAVIRDNELGPAGEKDGKWADGISLACRNSAVEGNTIIDATDGGIVVFGSPGSIIRGNLVVARTREMLGGINMVDYAPFHGDYRGTVVTQNTIVSRGGVIKVGLAIGTRIWRDTPDVAEGGVVVRNVVEGGPIAFGLAVAGVKDFVVQGNHIDVYSKMSNGKTLLTPVENSLCKKEMANPNPAGSVVDLSTVSKTTMNQHFDEQGSIENLICIPPR